MTATAQVKHQALGCQQLAQGAQALEIELLIGKNIRGDNDFVRPQCEPFTRIFRVDAAADLHSTGECGKRFFGSLLIALSQHDHMAAMQAVTLVHPRKMRWRQTGHEISLQSR